jgi:hypothetical protein
MSLFSTPSGMFSNEKYLLQEMKMEIDGGHKASVRIFDDAAFKSKNIVASAAAFHKDT